MALMIPDSIREGTTSPGERNLFRRFRRELPESCVVLHSLGLAKHDHKIWGECDFVIVSTMGIFIIEVKSGGVSTRSGKWVYTKKTDGSETVKLEGPFEQAKSAMFAVAEAVEAGGGGRGLFYGYGVIMPDENFTAEGPEIEPEVLLRSRDYAVDLKAYIAALNRHWTDKYQRTHGKVPRCLGKKEIETISGILRPEVRTALTLDSFLTNLDQQMVELTDEQARVLARIDSNPRTMVSGRAGTGKTILAIDKAIRLAEQGKKVLYLCYNRLLGLHVSESLKEKYGDMGGLLHSHSIHEWFGINMKRAGVTPPPQEAEDRFVEEYVDCYIKAMIELEPELFDALIIDEGQDLLRGPYLDAFDFTLKGGLARGSWHIFHDPLQNIYGAEAEEALAELDKCGYAKFELSVNCRNTKEVAVLTSIVSGLKMPLESAVEGGTTQTVFYSDRGDMHSKLDSSVGSLLERGASKKDVIVLSRFRLENSGLAGMGKIAGLWLNDLTSVRIDRKDRIDFCTMHSFKGLERKIVMAVDVNGLTDSDLRLLYYCGLSRAKTTLYVFMCNDEKTNFEILSREFGKTLMSK